MNKFQRLNEAEVQKGIERFKKDVEISNRISQMIGLSPDDDIRTHAWDDLMPTYIIRFGSTACKSEGTKYVFEPRDKANPYPKCTTAGCTPATPVDIDLFFKELADALNAE